MFGCCTTVVKNSEQFALHARLKGFQYFANADVSHAAFLSHQVAIDVEVEQTVIGKEEDL